VNTIAFPASSETKRAGRAGNRNHKAEYSVTRVEYGLLAH